jgi:flagellar motility protein MotE (MotC chaperone)
MIRILQNKWVAIGIGALAFALTTWLCLQPQKRLRQAAAALRATKTTAAAIPAAPSWLFQNPELNQLLAEVKDERETLRVRATQLDELEARLNAERQEICTVTQTVARLRKELDLAISRVAEEEVANLKKLAKVYATMSPAGAARILKEMDDEQVVKILALMKESESAPILEGLGQGDKQDVKRAATLSNRLRLTVMPKKVAAQ